MTDSATKHWWRCFEWDLTNEDNSAPRMFKTRTGRIYPHTDCDNLELSDVAKDQLIEDGDEFAGVIDNVFKALAQVGQVQDRVARNNGPFEDPKDERIPLAELSGALSDVYLALGALIAAQESRETGYVPPQTIGLTQKWQAAVFDTLIQSNDNVAEYDKIDMYESPMPRAGGWVGSWPLGTGTFGSTHLFIRKNEHGQTCNRIVIKNCDFDQSERQRRIWDDEKWFWVKDHRDQSIPIEVQTMSDLRGKNGSEFIVKLLNWRIAKERRLYRLYLEV